MLQHSKSNFWSIFEILMLWEAMFYNAPALKIQTAAHHNHNHNHIWSHFQQNLRNLVSCIKNCGAQERLNFVKKNCWRCAQGDCDFVGSLHCNRVGSHWYPLSKLFTDIDGIRVAQQSPWKPNKMLIFFGFHRVCGLSATYLDHNFFTFTTFYLVKIHVQLIYR